MSDQVEFEKIESEEPELTEAISEPEEDKKFGLDPKEDYSEMDEITARIMARKTEAFRRKKRAATRRKIFLGVVVLLIGLIIFSFSSFFDVDSIEVRGNSYFTAEEVINMAHAVPGKNLIYHPDKRNITNYLEDNPYIKDAKVSRQFPSTLVITVEERKQVGAIRYSDEYLIVDEEGILLRKTKTVPKLTNVEGIIIKKIKLGEPIGVEDEELLEQTLDLLKMMNKKDLYFVNIDMKDMYIKAYVYESLICKGTFKQLMDSMEDDKLHRVLDELFDDNIERGTITFSDEGYVSYVPTV